MLKNFIIISFRNLVRKRGFALINLMGLTMGLSVSFLILLYVFNELSYDKHHPASDRLYRIAVTGNLGEMPLNVAVTPGALAHNLADQMPEVEAYCMFEHLGGDQLFRSGDNKFYENHLVYADENLFKLFAFDFLYGDPETSLDKPYNLILRKSISEKFFGEVNSLGKTIRLNNDKDYIVTGIIEDPPEESHLAINIIASFETRISENGTAMLEDWGSMMYYSYIRLREGTNLEDFVQKMNAFFNENLIKEFDDDRISVNPYLQAVTDIHLNSRLLGEIKPNSELSYVYILSLIAAAILFIAGINFMNLATARSASRAKEVGIRKIVGSNRKKLIFQFVGESVFMSTLAFLLSLVLIELLLPVFNNVTHKNIEFSYYFNSSLLIIFLGISLFIGVFSGSYPAFYLSAFNPIKVLQSKLRSGSSNKSLRNILVFIQFAISSSLIACTIIIYSQLNFMQEKSLGFDKENLIAIFLRNDEVKSRAQQLKNEFRSQAVVESSSLASSIPGMSLNGSSYFPEGLDQEPWLIYEFHVDEDFVDKTFGMTITEGRNFSTSFSSDSSAVLINETLKKSLKWENPIGKTFTSGNDDDTENKLRVIGVVEDFHFRSLHERIEPTMIRFSKTKPSYLILRLRPGPLDKSLRTLELAWEQLNPDLPFDYEFVNESFSGLYSSERRLSHLFTYLSIFAIFIASLGLLGLISYTAEQRTKEIGIRKVLGASIFSLSKLLSIEYIRLIILANILAWPVSYKLMRVWLENFSYRIDIPLWPFVTAGLITLIISLLVINLQILKTARQNPVRSLRYE